MRFIRLLAIGTMTAGLVLGTVVATAAPAAERTVQGKTAAGAYYRFDVPGQWNGHLVLYNNGLKEDNVAPNPYLGPLAPIQLDGGFAVAATSYRTNFYSLFSSLDDLRDLIEVFRDEVGAPEGIIVSGPSMGTLVSIEAIEQGLGIPVVGALLTCGLYSSAHLTFFTDLRLAYDVECGNLPAAAIPGGALGLPADQSFNINDIVGRIRACTGVEDFRPGAEPVTTPTAAQLRHQENLLRFSTVPNGTFLLRTLLLATYALADTVHSPDKLDGGIGYTNIGARFNPRSIDRRIQRIAGDATAIERILAHYVPMGVLPDNTRIVALHTSRDGQNFVEGLGAYVDLVSAANITVAVAKEKQPTHCGFSAAELRSAWEALVDWLETEAQPLARDIKGRCKALTRSGVAEGPCRFAARYRFGDLADRIAPR